jgi:hypothetical protein
MNESETTESTVNSIEQSPVAEIYHSRELYGERMRDLREALENAGFELSLDPLQNEATLYDGNTEQTNNE